MKIIDISKWKDFSVGELFNILNGKGVTKAEIYGHPGTLPAIQSGEDNFGRIGFLDYDYCIKKKYTISKGECLTVARSGSSGYVGYQPTKCVVGDSAKILEPRFEANRSRLLFIRVLLMKNKAKYAYTDKVTKDNYEKDIIPLPIKADETPDWEFMEDYIRKVEEKQSANISCLLNLPQLRYINIDTWKLFQIGSLFTVKKGTRLTKANMRPGTINYIGASAVNNGITAKIGNTEHLHSANTITVNYNGSVGEAFYQNAQYWASDDVNVLYPNFELTENIALFLLPIIKQVGKQYAFTNKWKQDEMEQDEIPLPVDMEGNPDWDYIESYISGLKKKLTNNFMILL